MNKRKILITGSQGYIGTRLGEYLNNIEAYTPLGVDIGYFANCNIEPFEEKIETIKCDIREIDPLILKGIDAVVHLAALSNDPLGEFDPSLTSQINYEATLNLAKLAIEANVPKFIFVSSQSMYGISNDDEADEDLSEKSPITAYAETKWRAEQELFKIDRKNTCITSLRPSTVFGYSPRLRSDIVFNNLAIQALSGNEITLFSDGTPWRPVIHIEDVCHAIECILRAPSSKINGEAFNLGVRDGNYRVIDIAEAVSNIFNKRKIVIQNQSTDPRSYRISFKKFFERISDYSPKYNLNSGGTELVDNLKRVEQTLGAIDKSKTVRLHTLKDLVNRGVLTSQLRWS